MKISTGTPYPLGTTFTKNGVNFSLFTDSEEEVNLCLFFKGKEQPQEIVIPYHTGKMRHLFIQELDPEIYAYAYRIKYNEKENPIYLSDPYAKGLDTPTAWNSAKTAYTPLGLLMSVEPFDWEGDQALNIPMNELIIYEMHVRGFTVHPASQVVKKGTFSGLIEKIPHLVDLGINAVELLPIFEFNEGEYTLSNSQGKSLYQYWGYSTVNFFSPMNRYAVSEEREAVLHEFKTLVKELHKNGIEVILDVVYNHSAEGNALGPIYNYKGLANSIYYMLDGENQYRNYTGCGNTLNCNHPIMRYLILDSFRYWVAEMHVDGFRFDLASILYRGEKGEVLQNPPIVDVISEDPVLADVKFIAEPWDANGLYQVGSFYCESKRWSEWNARYRDCTRKFLRGEKGLKGEFATRLCGSQDLYNESRSPSTSINFVTCHDGFSLKDLVSYNQKHNLDNGEDNRDGTNENDSWNCGVEGPTNDMQIMALRERQMRNFHLALIISQGVPMFHMGDEYGHTKMGNNNTWCQDNDLNWFLWDELKKNQAFSLHKGPFAIQAQRAALKAQKIFKG